MFKISNIKWISQSIVGKQSLLLNKQIKTGVVSMHYDRILGYKFSTAQDNKATVLAVKTSDDWENKIVKSSVPVILDFYADWCGPCKRLMPLLEQRYKNADGKWLFAKCNVDEFGELAQAFQVSSIPAVFLIHGGEIKNHFLGLPAEKEIDEFIKKAIELNKSS